MSLDLPLLLGVSRTPVVGNKEARHTPINFTVIDLLHKTCSVLSLKTNKYLVQQEQIHLHKERNKFDENVKVALNSF